MEKITTSITLEPEVKKEIMIVLKSQDKKLSPLLNSYLKKYLQENQSYHGNTNTNN